MTVTVRPLFSTLPIVFATTAMTLACGGADAPVGVQAEQSASERCTLFIDEPVLGCQGASWGEHATFELLSFAEMPTISYLSYATNVSADGRVAIGRTTAEVAPGDVRIVPGRWDERGLESLFSPGTGAGWANAINCDGSVIAGEYDEPNSDTSSQWAFWWRKEHGTQFLKADSWRSKPIPRAISVDGSTLVGHISDGGAYPFPARWNYDGSDYSRAQVFPPPPPGSPSLSGSEVVGMSLDGQTIFGINCYEPDGCSDKQLYRRDAEGVAFLDEPFGLTTSAWPYNVRAWVSADTTHIVREVPQQRDTIRLWSEARGAETLTCPESPCAPMDISSRGQVVVVTTFEPNNPWPNFSSYLWTRQHGFRDVHALLAEHGVDLAGRRLSVYAISDDARVLVGQAQLPDGKRVAFRATLPRAAYAY